MASLAARGLLLVLAALLCVAAYFAGAPNVEGDLEGRRLALRDFAYRHLRRSLEPNANVDPEYAASFEECMAARLFYTVLSSTMYICTKNIFASAMI